MGVRVMQGQYLLTTRRLSITVDTTESGGVKTTPVATPDNGPSRNYADCH